MKLIETPACQLVNSWVRPAKCTWSSSTSFQFLEYQMWWKECHIWYSMEIGDCPPCRGGCGRRLLPTAKGGKIIHPRWVGCRKRCWEAREHFNPSSRIPRTFLQLPFYVSLSTGGGGTVGKLTITTGAQCILQGRFQNWPKKHPQPLVVTGAAHAINWHKRVVSFSTFPPNRRFGWDN